MGYNVFICKLEGDMGYLRSFSEIIVYESGNVAQTIFFFFIYRITFLPYKTHTM